MLQSDACVTDSEVPVAVQENANYALTGI
jgi:hypothetical protein